MARRRQGSEAIVVLAHGRTVGDLRDRPRQVRPAARSGHDRRTGPGVEVLGSGGVARVDMGQRDRHDPPAGATDLGFDRVEEGLAGIAGSTTTTSRRPTSTVLAGRPSGPKAL